jgi:hypothetical protein
MIFCQICRILPVDYSAWTKSFKLYFNNNSNPVWLATDNAYLSLYLFLYVQKSAIDKFFIAKVLTGEFWSLSETFNFSFKTAF